MVKVENGPKAAAVEVPSLDNVSITIPVENNPVKGLALNASSDVTLQRGSISIVSNLSAQAEPIFSAVSKNGPELPSYGVNAEDARSGFEYLGPQVTRAHQVELARGDEGLSAGDSVPRTNHISLSA